MMKNNYEEKGLGSLTVSENKCTWGGPWTETKLENEIGTAQQTVYHKMG